MADETEQPKKPKQQIGHQALQVVLSHERACFNDIVNRQYIREQGGMNGEYKFVVELFPDLATEIIDRWRRSNVFATAIMEQYESEVTGK